MKILNMADKDLILEAFNESPSGAFVFIEDYEPVKGGGEIADYYFQAGISYPNIVEMSIKQLDRIIKGEDETLQEITVKGKSWKGEDGILNSRKGKKTDNRKPVEWKKTFSWDSPEFQAACEEVMRSLEYPRDVKTPYDKEAKSLYGVGEGEDQVLYIRECLRVRKIVKKEGERQIGFTTPQIALKKAIQSKLSTGRYRTFKLDGRFKRIAINRTAIFAEVDAPLQLP